MNKIIHLHQRTDAGGKVTRQKFNWLRTILHDTDISATAYRLACLLMWEYRNEAKGGECYPGLDTLARDMGVNEKTIRRAISELVSAGYLRVERRGKQSSNLYWPVFGDRTFLSKVIGHSQGQKCPGNHVELWLENHGGGLQPPLPQCPTFEGSRETRLDGASPQRVFYPSMESSHPDIGDYTVIEVYPAEGRILVRAFATGEETILSVGPDADFTDDADDCPF
jgi:GntR family transcriptional regulator